MKKIYKGNNSLTEKFSVLEESVYSDKCNIKNVSLIKFILESKAPIFIMGFFISILH